jgi:MFS family permease
MSAAQGRKFKRIVWPLAIAQTLLWAGTYYLFPSLLGAWERDLGWSKMELTGALTTALLISAIFAPFVGRQIDKGHSHALFPMSTLMAAGLLALLSTVTELWQFYVVWGCLGLVMAGTLYEPCFSILTRYMGDRAQRAITLVTLLAGFAGTIAFPSSHALIEVIGWRGVTLVFAALIAFIAVPLNYYAISHAPTANPAPPEPPAENTGKEISLGSSVTLWLLAIAFAMIAFNHGAVIAHLLTILRERGVHGDVAVLAAAMIGPMQVTGRLAMVATENSLTSVRMAMLSFLGLGIAALALYGAGDIPMLIVVFVIFQGAGYGVTSILRPVLIANLLGRRKFGTIAGMIAVPFIVAFALGPSIAGFVWASEGYDAVIGLAGAATLIGLAALMMAAWNVNRERASAG